MLAAGMLLRRSTAGAQTSGRPSRRPRLAAACAGAARSSPWTIRPSPRGPLAARSPYLASRWARSTSTASHAAPTASSPRRSGGQLGAALAATPISAQRSGDPRANRPSRWRRRSLKNCLAWLSGQRPSTGSRSAGAAAVSMPPQHDRPARGPARPRDEAERERDAAAGRLLRALEHEPLVSTSGSRCKPSSTTPARRAGRAPARPFRP